MMPLLQVASHHKQDPRIHQYAKVSQLWELIATQNFACFELWHFSFCAMHVCRTGWA